MSDDTAPAPLLTGLPLELIDSVKDSSTGLRGCIAIHSTALGPAFGGCRMRPYPSADEAFADATRLAEGMTLKNALAGLPFGGGKAVIMQPETIADRREFFRSFGREVARLDGRYITAEDVGTTPADMRQVHAVTAYVSGIPRAAGFGGDPGRFTALGVLQGMRAAASSLLGRQSLSGLQIGIQGLGAVGSQLCAALALEGAELWIADVDPMKAARTADEWGGQIVSSSMLFAMHLDILAPCAIGGVLKLSTASLTGARIIAGAANNQLVSLEVGDRLHERGIWYIPDFLINAGGIIAVAREYLGTATEETVRDEVSQIESRTEELIAVSRNSHTPPARVAVSWAKALVKRLL